MVYAASNSQPPKTRTGAKYETQVDHQKELTNAHFFSHVVLYAAPVVPALFLIRATHATLCVVCRGIGVLPQIDLVRSRERESVIVQANRSASRSVRERILLLLVVNCQSLRSALQ